MNRIGTGLGWSNDKALQLIELYQQQPALWDTRCDDYNDQQKRHEAMMELAAQFHVEKHEIKQKLNSLLRSFYRELKRDKESKWSRKVYNSKWFGYERMSFLAGIDRIKPKPKRKFERERRRKDARKTSAQRQKSTTIVGDKSGRSSMETSLKTYEHQMTLATSPASTRSIKDKRAAIYVTNDVMSADLLYVDMNKQNAFLDSQIEFWEEKPIGEKDQNYENPIAPGATEANDQQSQQSELIVIHEDSRSNERPIVKNKSSYKVIPGDAIAPAIDFLVAEAKMNDSSNSELNFYRSLIPDTMKLSDKRRRQFKHMVLCNLNKFLDDDECNRDAKT